MKERYDDLDEYIADLKKEIEANAQCATHYYNLGLALLSKRDFVAAEEALLNAVRNSPHLAEAYVQLGGICLVAGLGGKDHRDGSLAYYFSEPVVCNDAKGVGPLVLAYTEMIARKN